MPRMIWLIPLALAAVACRQKHPGDKEPGTQTPDEVRQMQQEAAALLPMVRIEAGCFKMGTDSPPPPPVGSDGKPLGDAAETCVVGLDGKTGQCFGPYEDETPAHEVCLDTYEIDEHEVTFQAYQLCASTLVCEPSELASDELFWGPMRPAVGVPWYAAKAFCEWIGRRLPTEAEWEYAARGADGRTYPWGEEQPACDRTAMRLANEEGACDRYGTKNVKSYPLDRSAFGLYDMGGNAREWVSDWYHPAYYPSLAGLRTRNPPGAPGPLQVIVNSMPGEDGGEEIITLSERQHVTRGGTFLFSDPDTAFRTTNRRGLEEKPIVLGALVTIGFRCARSVTP